MSSTYISFGLTLIVSAVIWSLITDWKSNRCCPDYDCNHKLYRLIRLALILAGTLFLTLGLYSHSPTYSNSLHKPTIECKHDGCYFQYKLEWYERIP